MKDRIEKLKILRDILKNAYSAWLSDVWQRDLDEPYCCSGINEPYDYCGCGGMTVREAYDLITE